MLKKFTLISFWSIYMLFLAIFLSKILKIVFYSNLFRYLILTCIDNDPWWTNHHFIVQYRRCASLVNPRSSTTDHFSILKAFHLTFFASRSTDGNLVTGRPPYPLILRSREMCLKCAKSRAYYYFDDGIDLVMKGGRFRAHAMSK